MSLAKLRSCFSIPRTRECRWRVRPSAIALVFALASPLFALDPTKTLPQYIHQRWNIEHGLPQNTVTSILQTRDGYVWLGTQEGLARFDGVRFTLYNSRNTEEISNNWIMALAESADGTLWAGTFGGGVLAVRDGKFERHDTENGLSNNFVYSLEATADGSIWIGTNGGGLNRIVDRRVTFYRTTDGLPSDVVNSIVSAGRSSLWIGTARGLALFDNEKIARVDAGPLSTRRITALFVDPERTLWMAADHSIARRSTSGEVFTFTAESGELYEAIRPLYVDRQKNVWFGTGKGLKRLRDGGIESATQPELATDTIWSIYEDREGSLWVGTNVGGLSLLRNGKFTTYGAAEGLSDNNVRTVLEGKDGTVWVGTTDGLNALKDGRVTRTWKTADGLPDNTIMALFEDSAGDLWIGTNSGGAARLSKGLLSRYAKADGLSGDRVNAIVEDAAGDIWLGTNGGLTRLRNGVFHTYTIRDGLPSDAIRTLLVAHDGTLWIGTTQGVARLSGTTFDTPVPREVLSGLVFSLAQERDGAIWIGTPGSGMYRYLDGRVLRLTVADGLFDDLAHSILDAGDHLWVSCNRGIFKVSKSDIAAFASGRADRVRSIAYGHADGMGSSECNGGSQPAGSMSRDGRLWFATIAGVVAVHPQRIPSNQVPPPVHVESVVADRSAVTLPELSRLAAGTSNLEFHYTALSFVAPSKVNFRYRLRGFDRQWVDAGTRRTAYYTNVPAGRYAFEVTASNSDGVWSTAPASLSFEIDEHFYSTWWFYALCVLASLSLVATFVHIRFKLLHAKTALLEERTRLAQEIHDTVAQGLVGIMIEVDSVRRDLSSAPATAALHAEAASNLIRENLEETRRSVWALNPPVLETSGLSDALRKVVGVARAGSDVDLQLTVEGSLPHLPSEMELNFLRIVQEAISNALRHGMPRSVSVDVRCEDNTLSAAIIDDGSGFHVESPDVLPLRGFGLGGMHRRAEKIGATLTVTSAPGEGTTVVLKLPLRSWRRMTLNMLVDRLLRKDRRNAETLADSPADR